VYDVCQNAADMSTIATALQCEAAKDLRPVAALSLTRASGRKPLLTYDKKGRLSVFQGMPGCSTGIDIYTPATGNTNVDPHQLAKALEGRSDLASNDDTRPCRCA
jgi:hypothetical protein